MTYPRMIDAPTVPPDLTFVVMGQPYGQPRQRHGARVSKVGKAFSFNHPAKTSKGKPHPAYEWKKRIAMKADWEFENAHGPSFSGSTYTGPVRIDIEAYFKRPKNLKGFPGPVVRPSSPDWDNIGKAICDALEGVAYKNDGQIVIGTATTHYCAMDGAERFEKYAEPCTVIHLTWMEEAILSNIYITQDKEVSK